MKRGWINKVGKRGRMNAEANKIIRKILEGGDIGYCEAQLEGCMGNWPLQVAHRKRRAEYKNAEELAKPNEWIIACQVCHQKMDARTPEANQLTEELFDKLRG